MGRILRSNVTLAISWLCAAFAQAQMSLPNTTIELGDKPVRVKMETATKHPIVDVKINGAGPYKFVLDTGAGGTVIDASLVEPIHATVIGQARVGDATQGEAAQADLVKWDALEIGGVKFSNCWGVVRDMSELFRNEPDRPMGILGFRLFNECLMTLDYPKGEIVLERGALPEPDGKDVLELEINRGLADLKLELAGKPITLTVDSGAAFCLVLADDLDGKYPLKGAPKLTRQARRMNTKVDVLEARVAGDLKIGRHSIAAPTMHFGGVRSVLGYDVLSNFAVTFDQAQKRIRFARGGNEPIKIAPIYYPGFGSRFANDQREVEYVIADSPADKAGLKEGDVIVTANGKPARDYDRGAWRKLLESPGKLVLELKRDGKPVKASVDVAAAVE